ncbi:hypothetical protein [Prochlorothrix hollandica]|uniref:hypothetical protein n=1 Tax=Prochlorothrix hollandica TaxID=1223 RepID=UPI000347BB61|nr:hypothetical protein [Prochlorothrix hollandica]
MAKPPPPSLPPRPSVDEGAFADRREQQRLRLFIYLIPLVGFFPALWCFYGKGSRRSATLVSRRERQVSRMAITLGLGWLVATILVTTGSSLAELPEVGRLVLGSGLTSGYFLVNFWLMVQLWRNQRLWIPGISDLGDRLP